MKKWFSTLAVIGAALLAFGLTPAHAQEFAARRRAR